MSKFCHIIIIALLFVSCRQNNVIPTSSNENVDSVFVTIVQKDTVQTFSKIIRDTIYIERYRYRDTTIICGDEVRVKHIMEPDMLDSVPTKELMEKTLWINYIDLQETANGLPELYFRRDLEYLPYLYLTFMSNSPRPNIVNRLSDNFLTMCAGTIKDEKLFLAGKSFVDKYNNVKMAEPPYRNPNTGKLRHFTPWKYPDSFDSGRVPSFIISKLYEVTSIDTLRVRAIVHNDREALAKLEDYYQKINDPKGIAIYYKVMLGYEGNGDLAEKFYRVLEPYFKETPQFRMAVRETLLRAALCDHNARAQQLCDSLGFSLCDYRLPRINE